MGSRFTLHENAQALRSSTPPSSCSDSLRKDACADARAEISSWPGYRPTPLRTLPGLARAAGINELLYKDESERFGLGSFKALGGAYAVYRYLVRTLAEQGVVGDVGLPDLVARKHADAVSRLTVACATDGNHGRSVAWGAKTFGCACVIFIHAHVSEAREAAMTALGARVVRIDGNYDDSVRRAAEEARAHGWQIVSDTSYPGYEDVPREVMSGYTVMVDEVFEALPDGRTPTHVFVQGGVGGLAVAVCAPFWWRFGASRPQIVVVEPHNAACLLASAVAGRHTSAGGDLETVMAGLSCGEPSSIAWPLLAAGVDWFVSLDDEAALAAMRRLAAGEGGDPPVVGGESGVAGLAGMLALAEDPAAAARVGLDSRARVLVFGTEGDTDAALYAHIVGTSGDAVRARQRAGR